MGLKAWWKRLRDRVGKIVAALPDVDELSSYAGAFADAVENLGDKLEVLGKRGLMALDVARRLVVVAQGELPIEGAGADKLKAVSIRLEDWYRKLDGHIDLFRKHQSVLEFFISLFVRGLNLAFGKNGW